MNLIKLCDMREFFLKYIDKNDYGSIVDFVSKHNLKESLYFSLACLKDIYSDGYETELLSYLEITDISFMNKYGESTKELLNEFSSSLLERIFSCGNEKELESKPKLISFQK